MKKILFVILLLPFLFFAYIAFSYFSWSKDFKQSKGSLVCVSNSNLDIKLEDKFKDFVLSEKKYEYVDLSTKESLVLFKSISITGTAKLEDICILPNANEWKVYFNPEISGINLPWVGINVLKENRETAELYIDKIYLGGMEMPNWIVKDIVVSMNKGISDALLLVNENDFTGRKIQNIELLQDKIVVKGTI